MRGRWRALGPAAVGLALAVQACNFNDDYATYCRRTANCDGGGPLSDGGADGGGFDAGPADSGAGDAGVGDGGADAGTCPVLPLQVTMSGHTFAQPSLAVGTQVAVVAYTRTDGGSEQSFAQPVSLDTLSPLGQPVSVAGTSATVVPIASGFAVGFVDADGGPNLLFLSATGGVGTTRRYAGSVDPRYPLSLAWDGTGAVLLWDEVDLYAAGMPGPKLARQLPGGGPGSPLAVDTQVSDWSPYPTLGPPLGGLLPLAFLDVSNVGTVSGNFQLHVLDPRPDGGTSVDATAARCQQLDSQVQSPSIATAPDGFGVAWLNGSLFFAPPPNRVANPVVVLAAATAGLDGGSPFGAPSLVAGANSDAGDSFALSYVDTTPELVLLSLWAKGGDGGIANTAPLFPAASQSQSSLAYDAVRGRYVVAYVTPGGQVNVAAVCAP